MTLGKIRIESTGPTGFDKKIFIGDADISRYVKAATYRMAVNELDTVHLELYGNVELPEELESLITATKQEGNLITVAGFESGDVEGIAKEISTQLSQQFKAIFRRAI